MAQTVIELLTAHLRRECAEPQHIVHRFELRIRGSSRGA
jgi:DNA-binding LacI/PurR family transcriptional regulator